MTATTDTAAETVELSTEYRVVFLTASEIAEIDADAVLDRADVWERWSA